MSRRQTVASRDRRRWAEAAEATPSVNCGTCHLRDRCPDPRKRRDFACAMWIEDGVDPSSKDFADLMRDIVRRETVVRDPHAIDDRAAPLAPNSYVWNCGPEFLAFDPKPYPKQLELSLRLFGDMCSYCRGPWYDDIPLDCDVAEIPQRIRLREFGVCPRCHKTRMDGILSGRERDHDTLVSILGQRSGKSTGMSLIMSYQLHMLLKLKNPSAFYKIKAGTVLTNTIVGITYGGAKGNVFDPLVASIDGSPWFKCIAEGTPVSMADGSERRIERIVPGDTVKTLEGVSLVDQVFDNGERDVFELELANGSVLRLTDDHEVRCVIDGKLVWLPIKSIVEDTMVVVEDETHVRKTARTTA